MKCMYCGYTNDEDAEFCEKCGKALTRLCSHCGSPLKPGASFCKKCGTPVDLQKSAGTGPERLAILWQSAPPDLKEKIRSSSTRIEGERKPVTILFTDIVGSTALAEKLDPEEWKEIVSSAHQRISQAVYRYEGTIAQLLGDGVLAFFGAPVTHEDDPIRAVQAALDVQQAIAEYAAELKGYVENFQVRVGINSGTVVVGSVGSDLHMEYLAIGDAVNLAARLQTAARPGGILISESTARQVRAVFELQSLGEISLKGKREPVSVYEVLRRKAIPESSRGFAELSSPLIGRSSELAGLNEVLEELLNGHGQIVAIVGEAGIGKSRLVQEAYLGISARTARTHWIEGRALSYGQTLSFWTISQLIYNDLGLSDGDPEVRIRSALKRRLNALFGEKDLEVFPYLAQMLDVRLEGESAERVRQLDGETLRRQTLLSISRTFQRMAEIQPTVLVFEDLHWADPSSLEALEELLAVTDKAPLMLLLLSRLEREHSSWRIKVRAETDFSHRYTEIMLKPLTPGEQGQLIDNLLAIADLPVRIKNLVLEHSEGNPFYLEEVVRSLIEQDVIIREEEHWKATRDLTDITIPTTLEGVLLARIDRLQEDVRRTLQMASVIGKSFLYRLLEAIETAEQQLDEHLAQLQRVDLVREKARLPELEYMFKHSLTQDAAYNSLLLEKRREFHRKVGEALERLFANRIEQYLGLLAHHFEAAGDLEKAVGYLVQAGDRARLTDEHSEAIGFYQRAVNLLEQQHDEERLAQVWLKLGMIHHANFQFEAAHQANEKAFALQQKIPPDKRSAPSVKPAAFHFAFLGTHVSLDPGLATWGQDIEPIQGLFSGLAEINEELDVVPAVARSWQVLDEGRRYIFHLRSDATWTDGQPVTAGDFEWAWKRNLKPDLHSETAGFLCDVLGARAYHSGLNPDPDSVGVHTLDDLTLEVQLEQPVAYFPFIVTLPVAFPLPRALVETGGENWWQPGRLINNGLYCLKQFDPRHGAILERNPGYYRQFPGNAERLEWTIFPNDTESIHAYLDDRLDAIFWGNRKAPVEIPVEEVDNDQILGVSFQIFSPVSPPFDDLRVRKAFGLAFNRQKFLELFGIPIYQGGLVPPGMPGHSPGITLPYDPDLARRLLSEAGYPGGAGFPVVKGIGPRGGSERYAELVRQLREVLGVELILEGKDPRYLTNWKKEQASHTLIINGWQADYPDPDNFLRQSEAITQLKRLGWQDEAYDWLVEEASRTPDRVKRMAMYRQADHLLVAEQALVLPLFSFQDRGIFKPWVKNHKQSLLGKLSFHKLIIEEH
jgi:ABC-type oligopeptide transport system substrate-binding subunit/class 3 adenylate cyclase/ribosomal protein L40E